MIDGSLNILPGCLIRTICKYSILILVMDVIFVLYVFLWKHCSFSRKLYICNVLINVSCICLIELMSLELSEHLKLIV